MQLDDRAINFIQNAKAQGFSKEQVAQFLQDKGYDMGLGSNTLQQPQTQEQQAQDPYNALDKAKYTTRAAIEGAIFGLGDLVAGATNVPANYLAGNFQNPVKLFKEGRRDFVNEQEQFAKEHPAYNFAGELGGGLITGIAGAGKKLVATGAKQGLKQLAKTGAKEGAKFGAAYGGGSGLTSDADKLSIKNALLGAGTGGLGGAALGAAIPLGVGAVGKGTSKAVNAINYLKNKEINAINKVAGADVAKAIQEGRPLIDFANEGTLDLALGTKQADPKASQVYVNYARQRLQGQRPIINQMLKNTFGEKGSNQLLDELNAEVLKGSKVLYDRAIYQMDNKGNILLDNTGKPLSKVLPELDKLNKYELDYVSKVYGTKGLEYEVQGLPQNDMRILNYAKQLMDDDIQTLTNKGHNNQARILADKRAQFIAKIDKANPEYKTARAFYERGKQAEDALQAGRNFDKGNRENLKYSFNKLTPEQQAFYRLGAGDRIAEHTNVKTEGGNIAQRVFDAETMRRLKTIGVKDIDKLAAEAKKESITAANLQRLLQGSQTAEKQASVGRWAVSPARQLKRTIASGIDSLFGGITNPNAEQVAKMLTDPQYLRYMLNKSKTNTIQNALKGNYSAVAGNVSKALKDAKSNITNERGSINFGKADKKTQKKILDILKTEQKQISNGYNEVLNNPLKGDRVGKDDILATLKPSELKTYLVNRGAAIKDPKTGDIIVQGDKLAEATGTKGNFGFSKMIFKHGTTLEDAKKVPNLIREYIPYKVSHNKENYRIPLTKDENLLVVFGENGKGDNRLITIFREKKDANQIYSKKRPLDASANSGAIAETTNQVAGNANKESQRLNNSITQKNQFVKGAKSPKINDILKEAK